MKVTDSIIDHFNIVKNSAVKLKWIRYIDHFCKLFTLVYCRRIINYYSHGYLLYACADNEKLGRIAKILELANVYLAPL